MYFGLVVICGFDCGSRIALIGYLPVSSRFPGCVCVVFMLFRYFGVLFCVGFYFACCYFCILFMVHTFRLLVFLVVCIVFHGCSLLVDFTVWCLVCLLILAPCLLVMACLFCLRLLYL